MESVADRYLKFLDGVAKIASRCERDPSSVKVIAVSKTQSLEHALSVYGVGCRDFGENRIQEALGKIEDAPQGIRWHMIGSLQRKKVPKVVGKFSLIHSVDSPELAIKISQCGEKENTQTPILLQVNTSGELSKHGLSCAQWREHLALILSLPGIAVQGMMTMAPREATTSVIAKTFSKLRDFKEEIEKHYQCSLPHLSMGMSRDYPIAIAEGATLLRIGSALFA